MRNKAPALLPILRSRRQGELLALILLRPQHEYTMGELARHVGAPISSVHREVRQLVDAGIVRDRAAGRARLITANAESRLVRPLTDLVALTYGPLPVVADEFEGLDDVDLILVFGSWAARYQGEPGPPPRDVDVLVVGTPDRGLVYDAAERAHLRLGLPVNPTVSSRRRWEAATDTLIRQIRASPVELVVDRRAAPSEEER